MHKLLGCCSQLGIPIPQDKTEGPKTCLAFLGIEVHTQAMELRLPVQKLARMRQTVSEWLGRKAARRRELESLVGILQHATKVVRPGRRFVRRLIQVMSSVKERDHFVRLGADVRSDLMWWQHFLESWNGIGILPNREMGKELLPIVLVCIIWGKGWWGKKVTCHCDNMHMAIVEVLNSGYSKDKDMMHMFHNLFFISEHHHFLVEAVHLPGKLNKLQALCVAGARPAWHRR